MKHNPIIFFENPSGLITRAGIFMALALFSCGIKTLPVPPDVYTPPAVKDLSATFESGVVSLSWVVPDGHDQRQRGLSEVVVFQADRSASCPACPLAYEPIATVPAGEMAENDRGDLRGGHRWAVEGKGPFVFYVVAYSNIGVAGPDSAMVEIACPPEVR
jgi:hypothetical protein